MKTPQMPSPKLSAALGLNHEVWIKREDKHHYGSHKGRSIPLMISTYHKTGYSNFVISSSGNAALAAIYSVQAHNKNKPNNTIRLAIFIGENIEPDKKKILLEKIKGDQTIVVEQVAAPKQAAIQYEKTTNAKFLRQSVDDLALLGYTELAKELSRIENLQAVFVPTSSGTTAQGLYLGFNQLGFNPQIHIVQTTACHPLVDAFTKKDTPTDETPSLAGAIVDKVARRKEAVTEAVTKSHGSAWIATNEEIVAAIALAKSQAEIDISANSALSLVGLKQAAQTKTSWSGPVVCLITGQ